MKKYFFIIPLLLLICLVVFLKISPKKSPTAKPNEPKLQKVTIMVPFIAQIQWAPYYVAKYNGYYKDEGLEIEIQYSTKGSAGPIEQLVGGNVDFILSTMESLIKANSKGLDIVSVYLTEPTNVFYIVSDKKKNINKPSDLKGKKIGVISSASGAYNNLLLILYLSKMEVKEVEIISAGTSVVPSFLEGKFDAAAIHLSEVVPIQKRGVDLNIINASDYSNISSGEIAVTGNLIKKNPELIKKFLRATQKGLEYAVKNPEKTVDIYINYNLEAESTRQADQDLWNIFIDKQYYKEKISGLQSAEMWQKSQDLLFDAGIIEKKTDVAKMFTNDFIPQ